MGLLRIGKVVRALGLKGYLGIAGSEGAIARLSHLVFRAPDGSVQELAIEEARPQGKLWAVRVAGVSDRDGAEKWVGTEVLAERQDLGEAGEGHLWWGDLEGMAVETVAGEQLGKVTGLYATGGVDVLIVRGQEVERLIPLAPYVRVDRETGRVVVDPPEGLLELGAEEEKGGRQRKEGKWRGSRSKS